MSRKKFTPGLAQERALAKKAKAAQGESLRPPLKPVKQEAPSLAPPPPPAYIKLKRFRQAVEKEGSVGKVEWEEQGQPAGKCEKCLVSSKPHPVSILFNGELPYLQCSHGPVEGGHVAQYNEWLRATYVELYYHDRSGRFWTREADPEKWVMLTEGAAFDMLDRIGVSKESHRQVLLDVRRHYNVRYAGPLAGYKSGVYTMFGNIVLVTDSPIIIEARPGAWPTLRKFFEGLFGEVQLPYFYGWLKLGYEALKSGKHRTAQALAMAGERDSGKSLTQKLITKILGGRVGRPYSYMCGKSDFNHDLFSCEHLAIEDQKASIEWHTRRAFGTALKDIVTVTEQRCHRKFVDAIILKVFWRLSISLNDEPENLCVLPPFDKSIGDKIILLRVSKGPMPMPTTSQIDFELFWRTLVAELPAFLHYLTAEWQIPAHLLTGEGASRFGLAHYHDPILLQSINELENEFRMLQLLDMTLFASGRTEAYEESQQWYEQELRKSSFAREAEKLFSFAGACGAYFARLAEKWPERVRKHRTSRKNTWILYPPQAQIQVSNELDVPKFMEPEFEEPW